MKFLVHTHARFLCMMPVTMHPYINQARELKYCIRNTSLLRPNSDYQAFNCER